MMDNGIVHIKQVRPSAKLPFRATPGATGHDLYACLDEDLEIGPAPVRVPTGIAIEVPPDFDVQIRPRSGLTAQGVMTAFGTIDTDYRGELLVTMYVLDRMGKHTIHNGDRIAQLVIAKFLAPQFKMETQLSESERGAGGHGSTGR
jgi:dUTP pyrophosphatase